jgi:hypothetical protein
MVGAKISVDNWLQTIQIMYFFRYLDKQSPEDKD